MYLESVVSAVIHVSSLYVDDTETELVDNDQETGSVSRQFQSSGSVIFWRSWYVVDTITVKILNGSVSLQI